MLLPNSETLFGAVVPAKRLQSYKLFAGLPNFFEKKFFEEDRKRVKGRSVGFCGGGEIAAFNIGDVALHGIGHDGCHVGISTQEAR